MAVHRVCVYGQNPLYIWCIACACTHEGEKLIYHRERTGDRPPVVAVSPVVAVPPVDTWHNAQKKYLFRHFFLCKINI
jgi:hypothetical protein